jgi:hypothetical protein
VYGSMDLKTESPRAHKFQETERQWTRLRMDDICRRGPIDREELLVIFKALVNILEISPADRDRLINEIVEILEL